MDTSKANREASPQDIETATHIRTVIHRLVKILRRQTLNEELLSLTERSTMGLLYQQGELPPNELAQQERVTAQSMSQVISHLFELHYINKTPSGADKRKVLLSLTPAGREYIERARQEKQEWLARTLHEKASAAEKEILSRGMDILARLIDE